MSFFTGDLAMPEMYFLKKFLLFKINFLKIDFDSFLKVSLHGILEADTSSLVLCSKPHPVYKLWLDEHVHREELLHRHRTLT